MTVSTRTPQNIDAAPLLSGNGFGPLVGGDGAMVTSDGDTSYAEVARDTVDMVGTVYTGHTFTWTPAGAIPPDAVVTIEADWFTATSVGFYVAFVHPDLGGRTIATFTPGAAMAHAYGDVQTFTVSPTWVEDGAAFAPGVVWSIEPLAPGPTELGMNIARITRLTMRIETAGTRSPHLIFWRHDNLGAGGNLVFQPNTRQSTGLVFGNN